MAKVIYPSWVDAISGLIDNLVFCAKDVLPNKEGLIPGGYVRKHAYTVSNDPKLVNIRQTFSLVSSLWDRLNSSEAKTWEAEAKTLSLGYDVTGRMLFFSYVLTKYASVYSAYFRVASISTGSFKGYAERNQITFIASTI